MSDAAATDAAVAAPAPVEPAAPEAPQAPAEAAVSSGPASSESGQNQPAPEATKPTDRLSLRDSITERARQRFTERKAALEAAQEPGEEGAAGEASVDRPRDAQGRFTKPESEDSAAPAGAAHADDDAASRDSTPEGFVRIELPEGHPLRRGDKTHWTVPADIEQDTRTALNQFTRRADLEAAQRRMLEAEVRAELALQGKLNPEADPERKQLLDELKREYPERYEEIKRFYEAEAEKQVGAEVENRLMTQMAHESTREFLAGLQSPAVRQRFDMWSDAEFQARFSPARLQAYADYIDAERQRTGADIRPTVDGYVSGLMIEYARDPRVQQRARAQASEREQKLRQEAMEQARRELEAQRHKDFSDRHRPVRGVGQLNRAAVRTTGPSVDPSPPPPEQPTSPSQRRDAARQNARERALQLARERGY